MDDLARTTQITLIANLIPRLAHEADHGTLEEYAKLLAEDFVWDFPGSATLPAQVITGRDKAISGAQQRRDDGIQGPGTHTRHVVASISVDPDPEAPTATTYWHFLHDTHATPRLVSMGRYHDTFTRGADGNWVIQRRRIVVD